MDSRRFGCRHRPTCIDCKNFICLFIAFSSPVFQIILKRGRSRLTPLNLNMESPSRQATERRWTEDTKLGTVSSITMALTIRWLIPRGQKNYVSDMRVLGVQSLNVLAVLGATLQPVVAIIIVVSKIDSVVRNNYSPWVRVSGELNNSAETYPFQITRLDFIVVCIGPIKSSCSKVYCQPTREV